MAKIEIELRSGAVRTFVRGRVMRSHERGGAKQYPQPASKERRRVCVLSARGARELEHWGMAQPCYGNGCHHHHQTREEVEKLVREGVMRWVGIGKNVAAYSFARTWQGRTSAGMKTMQLVVGLRGRHVPAGQKALV